jgi:hypothetical protein
MFGVLVSSKGMFDEVYFSLDKIAVDKHNFTFNMLNINIYIPELQM